MSHDLLNIDYLKSLNVEPKWFGLGFIQLKLDSSRRMHFWHPDLKSDDPSFEQEYHDHRYNFDSDVLVGQITNHLVNVTVDYTATEYSLYDVCCSGGGQSYRSGVTITRCGEFTTMAGSSYFLHRDMMHRVSVDRCVTLQTRGMDVKDRAGVVQRNDTPSPNPFSTSIETKVLWGYIDDLLPKHGYHISDIPKGQLGEASKIVEEALELEDAVRQNARVMELVELSDLMGAVEAFLKKHHGGYSLDDLRTFSQLTQRAFQNGHRV